MRRIDQPWDYLVLTASNCRQGKAYEEQIELRRSLGLLPAVRQALVIPDPFGRRVGSGGSTLYSLAEIIRRELDSAGRSACRDAEEVLRGLRILIVHAGGDSRRLPAYSPCGKIFLPLPGESQSALAPTLFDRLAPIFLGLPASEDGAGQVVVASGDALILFDPRSVRFTARGLTALGSRATPEEAARHGVFCLDESGGLRLYLQKPSLGEQAEFGAAPRSGMPVLDLGVMSLDAAGAAALLRTFGVAAGTAVEPPRRGGWNDAILAHGLDLYREICCAMGSGATFEHYLRSARGSGSHWDEAELRSLYPALREIPLYVHVVPECDFLHFGATGELIGSGLALLQHDGAAAPECSRLLLTSEIQSGGAVSGSVAWVEGCRISAPLGLGGSNVVTGVDVDAPLSLPPGACLDLLPGRGRDGCARWFVRCYGVKDAFKDAVDRARFCGQPLLEWIRTVGAKPEEIWEASIPPGQRTLWEARVFPAEKEHGDYRRWLWMFRVERATPQEKRAFLAAERYSAAEITLLTDQKAFHSRRASLRSVEAYLSLGRLFSRDSAFSADDLTYLLGCAPDRAGWVPGLLDEAQRISGEGNADRGLDDFVFCRIAHSLGSAVAQLAHGKDEAARDWGERLKSSAFRRLNETILKSSLSRRDRPRNALRGDETIWGRAPARIELG